MLQNPLTLQPFTWDVVDQAGEEGKIQIRCWCLDREDKNYLIRIEDYPASCFIELPSSIEGRLVDWFDSDVDNFMRTLLTKLGQWAPQNFSLSYKPKLYYFQEKKFPMIHLTFNTLEAMDRCVRYLKYPLYFKGKGRANVQVWEQKIPFLRKFLTRVRIEPAQWFKINAREVTGDDKISRLEHEYIASWKQLVPLSPEEASGLRSHPKIAVLDIEAMSKNYKAFPDKYSTTDVCYLISLIIQRVGLPETRKRYAVIYGECRDVPGAKVIQVDSEIECINTFSRLIREEDPDIISGYNHHGFDNDYMNERLARVMEEWLEMGRIIGEPTELVHWSWASSAYGHNDVNLLKTPGRISIDMLPVVKRDYKLPRYDLDTVGRFFLGRGKHPVKPEDIFKAYDNYWASRLAHETNPDQETKQAYEASIDEMTRITCYCIEDSELTLDLAEKVHIWIASVELSNIVGVTIMDLYTRGQQIRCLSKIYDEAHRQGYVIDFQEALNVIFNGGAVEKPDPGIEDEVPAYDVNSMYPNIIIKENICYTTFIPDTLVSTIQDEECNVIPIEQIERPKHPKDKVSEEDFDPNAEVVAEEGKLVQRRLRFIKKERREGIVPKILRTLLKERKEVRTRMEELKALKGKGEKIDEVMVIVLNQRQLALKVTANSFFGFMGAYIGRLPLIEGAMAITGRGREMVGEYKRYLREEYGARIVYGDTDSVMPKFFQLDRLTWSEKWAFWERINQELSAMFPGITLEMEKVMRIICFAPKMYAYLQYSKDGILDNDPKKIQAKGIVLARRDGTPWVRYHYRRIIFSVLINYSPNLTKQIESIETCFNMIVDVALDLQEGRVNWEDLSKINEVSTKARSPIAPLVEHLRQIDRPTQPGDRLRYIICDIPGCNRVGEKMRTDDEYLESQSTINPLRLDVNYYLENALLKKIDPLFQIAYNKILPYAMEIGYKPNSRKHFVSVINPVKLIARVIEDGEDIKGLKSWFKEHLCTTVAQRAYKKPKIVIRRRVPAVVQLD